MTDALALDPDHYAVLVICLIVALFVLCMVCSIVARLRPEPATRTRPTSSNRKAGRGSL